MIVPKRLLLPLLGLAAVGPVTAAQQVFGQDGYSRPLNYVDTTQPYSGHTVCDLDGDKLPDGLFVVGREIYNFWGMGTFDAQSPTYLDADDVISYRNGNQQRARLIKLYDGEISVVLFDPGGTMIVEDIGLINGAYNVVPIPGQTPHLGAKRIVSGDMDGDGDLDVVFHSGGLAPNGGALGFQIYFNNGDDTWSAGPVLHNAGAGAGYDLAIADTDGDQDPEVAFSGSGGLTSHEYDHATGLFTALPQHTLNTTGTSDPVAGLKSNFDLGALGFVGTFGASQFFATLDQAGLVSAVNIGQVDASNLIAADYNNDGLTDLAMTEEITGYTFIAMQLWRSVAHGAYWDFTDPHKFFVLPPPGGNGPASFGGTPPLPEDFDGDNDVDLCTVDINSGKIHISFNNTQAASNYRPIVTDVRFVDQSGGQPGAPDVVGNVKLDYSLPTQADMAPFTHLRWFVIPATYVPADGEDPATFQMQPVIASANNHHGWKELGTAEQDYTASFPWDVNLPAGTDDIAVVVARYAQLDLANERVLRLGPHLTYCYAHNDGPIPTQPSDPLYSEFAAVRHFLSTLPGSEPITQVPWVNDPLVTGGEETGGTSPCDCLPTGCAPPPWPPANGSQAGN